MASFLRGVPPRLLPLKNARPACTRRSCERKFHRSVRKTGENRKNPRPPSVPTFPPLRRQRFFGNAARSFTLNRRGVQKIFPFRSPPALKRHFGPISASLSKRCRIFMDILRRIAAKKACAAVTMSPSDGRSARGASGLEKGRKIVRNRSPLELMPLTKAEMAFNR